MPCLQSCLEGMLGKDRVVSVDIVASHNFLANLQSSPSGSRSPQNGLKQAKPAGEMEAGSRRTNRSSGPYYPAPPSRRSKAVLSAQRTNPTLRHEDQKGYPDRTLPRPSFDEPHPRSGAQGGGSRSVRWFGIQDVRGLPGSRKTENKRVQRPDS